MKQKRKYKYVENYLLEIQSEGMLYFSLNELKERFSNYTLNSLQMNLKRLRKKNIIRHITRGFYVIVPPTYSRQKILPPELFIDALFKYLKRKYYVGLLSAAFYQGASHQQPQEYFVIISKPSMRSIEIEGLKINFIVKSNLGNCEIEDKKSSTGYFKISTPEQTAIDLVYFQNRVGGLNRVATVIFELSDNMNPNRFKNAARNCKSNAVLQRLGYILEKVVKREDLSTEIIKSLSNKKLYRVPLKANFAKTGFSVDTKWKVIENPKIETDF